jgi:ATP-dependent DNA ligase
MAPSPETTRLHLPMLAKPTDKVPSGGTWVHEIKLDGYRLQIHKRGHA